MSYVGNTPTTQAFSPAIDYFSGNGSTVAFTLSRPVASVAQVQVTVNNVPQNPSTAFTVSSNTITFTGAPSSGTNNIYVQYTSPITQVIQPGQGTVGTTQLADSSVTTAKIAAGAVVQADLATNVASTGPAFSAIRITSNVNISSATWTKISFNSTDFDTNSVVNTSTGTITPTVAGYYQVCLSFYLNYSSSAPVRMGLRLYKNGSAVKGDTTTGTTQFYGLYNLNTLVYCNGTTDYLEMYAYQQSSTDAVVLAGGLYTYMTGVLVRAA